MPPKPPIPPPAGAYRQRLPSVRDEIQAPERVNSEPPSRSGDKALRARGRGWSIAIPAGFLLALAPLVAPVVQHFVALEREIAAMRTAFTGQQERFDALERTMATQAKEAAELRSTVARLSGYLEGALGAAGVKVKAEAGATAVDVQTEGPAPTTRRAQVRLTTPVPAPKPH